MGLLRAAVVLHQKGAPHSAYAVSDLSMRQEILECWSAVVLALECLVHLCFDCFLQCFLLKQLPLPRWAVVGGWSWRPFFPKQMLMATSISTSHTACMSV